MASEPHLGEMKQDQEARLFRAPIAVSHESFCIHGDI